MSVITVKCKKCPHTMRFGQEKAGKRAKCPKCGTLTVIEGEANGVADEPPPMPETPPAEADRTIKPPSAEDLGEYDINAHQAPPPDLIPLEGEEQEDKKKKKKKLPKVQRKVKPLENLEEWEKVRLGLVMLFAGVCLWAVAHLLHGSYVLLGSVDFPEYAHLVGEELVEHPDPPADLRDFRPINQFNVLVGMVAGSGFLGYGKVAIILSAVLTFFQLICFAVGYGIALSVPERFGTQFQVRLLLGLVAFNFLMLIFFVLLPVVGAYQFYLIPLIAPEISMTDYNIERSMTLQEMWSGSLFWEMQLALLVQFVFFLEPVIGATLLWSIGLSIKEERLEKAGHTLTHVGLGTFFILLAYQMISVCGTSSVLVTTLRVLYTLWFAFLFLFILRYGALLLKARELLQQKMYPANPTAF